MLALGIAVAIAPAARLAHAQQTHLWTQSQFSDFEKGTPQGVAITSDGYLRQGPGLTTLLTTPSTFVWSVAVDKNGVVYAATGSPATVLRLGKKGEKPFTLFRTKDLTVQVIRFGPDGALYAATLPSGKVYRLNPNAATTEDDATATVVFDASKLNAPQAAATSGPASNASANKSNKPRYIWDLTFDKQGRLYIAAGDPGAIYRVDLSKPGARPETFFKTDEAHIRALAWDASGNLIAGSDGSGLVYRISPSGKGYVVFDSPLREVTSVAVAPDGTIYAACVGDKGRNPLPPLPVQGTATVTITVLQPGSMQAANASASIPEGSQIYALKPSQAPRLLWASKDDVVYALAMRPDGLVAITGNRGHIFRIADDGSYADIGHLDAQQGLSLAVEPDSSSILIGTGNTGKVVRLGAPPAGAPAAHEYASDVLDAGAFARFGRLEVQPGSSGYQFFTRTGNIEQPVRGWTDWQPLNDGQIASPPGRFLQWKVELQPRGAVGTVGVNYLPVNTAPVIDDLVVVPGARLNPQPEITSQQTVNISFPSSGDDGVVYDASSSSSTLQAIKDRSAVTVRWAAHDDNGDKLVYSVYLRGDGETVWRLLKDHIKRPAYSFEATRVPDGGYRVKVVASNAPSEPPGQALTADKVSDRFVIDTTPPVVSAFTATPEPCSTSDCAQQIEVVFNADDTISPIVRAQYSLDAGPWQYIDPVGMLSDSKHEHYDFRITAPAGPPAEHLITVRVYDRYDNVGLAKTVIPASGNSGGEK